MVAAPRSRAERTAGSPTSPGSPDRRGRRLGAQPAARRSRPFAAPTRGIRSGSDRREIADAAAGERGGRAGRRTSPGGAGRKHRRFLASLGWSGPGDAGWRRGGDRGGWRPTLQTVLLPRLYRSLARPNSCLQRNVDAVATPVTRDLSFPERSFLEDSFVFSLGPRAAPTDACPRARILLPSVSWLGTGRILCWLSE